MATEAKSKQFFGVRTSLAEAVQAAADKRHEFEEKVERTRMGVMVPWNKTPLQNKLQGSLLITQDSRYATTSKRFIQHNVDPPVLLVRAFARLPMWPLRRRRCRPARL